VQHISSLHYITQDTAHASHAQLAEYACQGGIDWVQLRVKNIGFEEWKKQAVEVKKVCQQYKAKLLINDNVKVAEEIQADGVHLGKQDMDADKARDILGEQAIIGGTANTYEDILRLAKWKVDYIGLGPFRFTTTKENLSPILGMEGYKAILESMKKQDIHIPLIAIGGITIEDVPSIKSIGVHGIAISGAISHAPNVSQKANEFVSLVKESK